MKKVYGDLSKAPVAPVPLSEAVEANGLVFLSGQIHLDENTELLEGSTADKTHQTMKNVQTILEKVGLSFADVVKATIYVTEMSMFGELNKVYASYFENEYPAREVVCVKELPLGASLEISMVAAR